MAVAQTKTTRGVSFWGPRQSGVPAMLGLLMLLGNALGTNAESVTTQEPHTDGVKALQRGSLRGTQVRDVPDVDGSDEVTTTVTSSQNQTNQVQDEYQARHASPGQSQNQTKLEDLVGLESEVQQLVAAPMSVYCVCKLQRGDLFCGSMFYDLLECDPSCEAICHGKGMAMSGCAGMREVGWYHRLHYRYTDCKGSALQR